jgi:hypothetical protein
MLKTALALLVMGYMTGLPSAMADDTAGDKVENAASATKTKTKKALRGGKRHARNATGNESKVEDAKDKAKDAQDDVKNEETKAKNQVD